jgi:Xaa-Pro dipeptidase
MPDPLDLTQQRRSVTVAGHDAQDDLEIQPVSQFRVPAIEEVDHSALRAERLARLQSVMRERDVAVCLFFEPMNIRYATGASSMDVWAAMSSVRYCLVCQGRAPILFEQELALPYASKLVDDVRMSTWWQWLGGRSRARADQFATGITEALRDLGADGEPVAVDRIETLGYLALQDAGIRLTPAGATADAAREVKTPEELKLLIINGAIGDAMLADFEAAIRPGIREYELFAVLSDGLLRRHGELIFTRLVSSGRNTNPWGSEAHDKMVMPGDLIAVDTDAIGYQGYLIDVSRTFHCGVRPTREQVELYRVAHECVTGMRAVARPGMSYREFAEAAPTLPERFQAQRYDIMVHGAGLEDEGPIIYYPGQDDNPDDEYLKENMVLCFECYVGAVGGPCGVKLEDQVLLTAEGTQMLSTYPYDARLLGLA